MPSPLYALSSTTLSGETVSWQQFQGQVLLIVNTASQCGFTPQYGPLQALYDRHRAQGLCVIGFPCNQFGHQEPGDAPQIAQFCETQHGITFPMMSKVDVNGPNAHPVYQWLRQQAPGLWGTQAIKWNFTKFLVGRDGQVIQRYAPLTAPEQIENDILKALACH